MLFVNSFMNYLLPDTTDIVESIMVYFIVYAFIENSALRHTNEYL